jgi:hypothetical protein
MIVLVLKLFLLDEPLHLLFLVDFLFYLFFYYFSTHGLDILFFSNKKTIFFFKQK